MKKPGTAATSAATMARRKLGPDKDGRERTRAHSYAGRAALPLLLLIAAPAWAFSRHAAPSFSTAPCKAGGRRGPPPSSSSSSMSPSSSPRSSSRRALSTLRSTRLPGPPSASEDGRRRRSQAPRTPPRLPPAQGLKGAASDPKGGAATRLHSTVEVISRGGVQGGGFADFSRDAERLSYSKSAEAGRKRRALALLAALASAALVDGLVTRSVVPRLVAPLFTASFWSGIAPLASIALKLSPMPTILKVRKSGDTGELPMLPYTAMATLTFVLVAYGEFSPGFNVVVWLSRVFEVFKALASALF